MPFKSDKQRRSFFAILNSRPGICYLDTETTGGSKKDQVLEVAAVVDTTGGQKEYHTYIQPTCRINPYAADVHGITWEYVKDAPLLYEVKPDIQDIIDHSDLIIAHNVSFDIRMLRQDGFILDDCKIIDTMQVAKEAGIDDGGDGKVSMDDMMKDLNVEIPEEDRHSAIGDAKALSECYKKLMKRSLWRR